MPHKERCRQCQKWVVIKKGERHHLCHICNNERLHPSIHLPAATSSSASSPSLPLFERDGSGLTPLSVGQRWAIITLYKDGQRRVTIEKKVGCSPKTVNHWINYYENTGTVADKRRSGRKRKTDENTDINIIATAIEKPKTTPKNIKREQDLSVLSSISYPLPVVSSQLVSGGCYGTMTRSTNPSSFKTGYF